MSRRRPLTISGKPFETQKPANLVIQELLNSQPLNEAIPGPYHPFLCGLASRHPRTAEKVDSGISHFTFEHALHEIHRFYATGVDGTKSGFSHAKRTRGHE